MRKKSLGEKSLTQFVIAIVVLLILSMPLFYHVTRNFYAEDMIELTRAIQQGKTMPDNDIEEDVIQGMALQFLIIASVLGIAMVLTMTLINHRLWEPFERTLKTIEDFRVENKSCPMLLDSNIKEFSRLNTVLNSLMQSSRSSYWQQKEFAENASHEMQTPLAVFQSQLDLLLQQSDITDKQAEVISSLYQNVSKMKHLNRSLLMLTRMDGRQFATDDDVDIVSIINTMLPQLAPICPDIKITTQFDMPQLKVKANRTLVESLINNLIVNAMQHNRSDGVIDISISQNRGIASLSVANTSNVVALNPQKVFTRFYRPAERTNGNGLGLSIIKAIADYHSWHISYRYADPLHIFDIAFTPHNDS